MFLQELQKSSCYDIFFDMICQLSSPKFLKFKMEITSALENLSFVAPVAS